MSGTTIKGIKRSSSLSSSRRIATSAAKSRTSAGKSSRPKPIVKKKAEKAPALKATKGKVTTSANKSKKTTAKPSAARTKASSKAEKPLKLSASKTVSPQKATKKAIKKVAVKKTAVKKVAVKKATVKKEVKKKVAAKPKVSAKTSKKAAVKPVKKAAKVTPKTKKAAVAEVKQKKSLPKTVKAKASRPVKKSRPRKATKKIILPPPRKILPPPTPRQPSLNEAAALKVFEKAHKEFARGRFTEARNQFRALLEKHSGVVEVAARARTYLAIAESRMKTETSLPKDADSLYDRGVIELNRGEYATAQDFFERALKHEPNAAHIFYGIAATKAQLGETEEALKFLEQSFTLDPVLRFRSAQDPDLTPLHSVPEFEQLVAS